MLIHEGVPRYDLMAISNSLTGAVAGAFFWQARRRERERQMFIRERLHTISEMNHHIRNALQTIVYVNSANAPSEDTARVTQATQRIDWALREIPRKAQTMPESNPNHHIDLRRRRPSS